ncbi:aquaporin-like protein, partial [Dimargaris cristalligena]
LAEFMGTFLFVFLGLSVNVALKTNPASAAFAPVLGALGWGLSLALGISVAASSSGGHVNPAVTLALVAQRRFPCIQALGYIVFQVLGAFAAALVVHLIQIQTISAYADHKYTVIGDRSTADLFACYPSAETSNWTAFFVELVGTAVLVISILNNCRETTTNAGKAWLPFAAGFTLVVLAVSFGAQTGGAFNPARDYGPRLYTFVSRWGWQVFSAYHFYSWIPVVAPVLGAQVGTLLFDIFL